MEMRESTGRRPGALDEAGAGTVALALVTCMAVLVVVAVAVVPIGAAVNDRTLARTAADATALAGAQGVLDGVDGLVAGSPQSGSVAGQPNPGQSLFGPSQPGPGSATPQDATAGLPAASGYALANGAQVLSYRAVVDGSVVRVTVEVQLNQPSAPDGVPARGRAVAEADPATGVPRLVGAG
ncbi:MAG: hypothetical protein ACRCZD_01835 [Phycicoccus sp.]